LRSLVQALLLTSLLISNTAFAIGAHFGFTLPIMIKGKDPDNLHGVRANLSFQADAYIWKNCNLYFIAGFGHWSSTHAAHYRSVNIVSAAPVFRFYMLKTDVFSPFAELSIGPSYISKTRFADRNLGMHFAFQDEISLGLAMGKRKQASLSLSALHYSNGSLASMNAGITMPLMLNLAYHF
jgi:hypothetical protein